MDFATLTPKVEALLMAAPSLEFPGCKQAGFSANRWDRKRGAFPAGCWGLWIWLHDYVGSLRKSLRIIELDPPDPTGLRKRMQLFHVIWWGPRLGLGRHLLRHQTWYFLCAHRPGPQVVTTLSSHELILCVLKVFYTMASYYAGIASAPLTV